MLDKLLWLHEEIVVRFPRRLLAVMGALLVLSLLQIPNLFIETSSDTLVLEGDRDLKYYNEVRAEFPEGEFLLVSYAPHQGNILEPANVRRLTRLVDQLGSVRGVARVNSLLDVPLLSAATDVLSSGADEVPTVRSGAVDAEVAAKEFRESSLYRDLVSNRSLSVAAIQVILEGDVEYRDAFYTREDLRHLRRLSKLSEAQSAELERIERRYEELAREFQGERAHIVRSVRTVLDGHRDHADMFVGGVPMISVDMVRYVRNDLVIFGLAVGLLVICLLVIIFRDWRWVVLPLLNCFAVAGFTLGFLIWVGWHLTIVSANFLLLLFILTLSLTVHLVVRYRELQVEQAGLDHRELVRATVRNMRTPCTYMIFTTLVSFVSLYFSEVRPVIDFGLMMGLACLILLVWSFLFFPASLVLVSQPARVGTVLDSSTSYTRYCTWVVERLGSGVVWISLLVFLVGVYGLTQLKVENRFIDYFDEDTEIHQGMLVIDKDLGGTIPFEILLTEANAEAGVQEEDDLDFALGEQVATSPWFSNRGLKKIKQVHAYLESRPESGKVLSLAVLYDIIEELLGAPPDDVQLAVLKESLPDEVRDLLIRPYLSEDGAKARIAMRVKETSRDLVRKDFLDEVNAEVQNILDAPSSQVDSTGLLVLYNNLLQSLYRSQVLTLGVVLLLVSAMFMVLFRSITLSLIALAPNLLACTVVLGGMGLSGIPLDMVTVIIAALVVGIGVDDTVHYVWRFRREFAKDRDYDATMHRCHGSVGRAIGYTSLVIVSGLSLLVISNFVPSVRFGLLTSLAMTIALVATLVLLPQLIRTFKPFGPERVPDSTAAARA